MNYEKYNAEVVEGDHTLLGKLGLEESTVGSIKNAAKTVANLVGTAVHTVGGAAKLALPGVAHAASAAVGGAMIARDSAAAASTQSHIMGLQAIQSDLVRGTAQCSCDHCLEAVGYAISQKTRKLEVKLDTVQGEVIDSASPVPMHVGAVQQAARLTHTLAKQHSGTRGVERNRQANLLHEGARGVRFKNDEGASTFHGYCVVARAIVDELTNGHWQRWVADSKGNEEIFRRLKSR